MLNENLTLREAKGAQEIFGDRGGLRPKEVRISATSGAQGYRFKNLQ